MKKSYLNKDFAALILAAGSSGRMGAPKLSLPFSDGQSFIGQCVCRFLAFGCQKAGVVVNEEGAAFIRNNKENFPPQMIPILNPHPEKGRLHSIKTGIAALQHDGPLFIHNVDNPFVHPATLKALSSAFTGNHCVCPQYQDRGGHPVLIPEKVSRELLREENPDMSLKEFLQAQKVLLVEVDQPEVLININTPEEYRRWFS